MELLDQKQRSEERRRYFYTFLWGFSLCALMFLPFVIYNGGLFVFMGDYNVQQIPFYQLAHDAIREGNIFWSFYTDLGANFIGSYSFYLLGSPFFYLTLPFPNSWLPYLMAPLFCLKFATAAVCAYAYIKRFVKNRNLAMLGGILYAFSGYSIYNIFFNHFHDVVAFFPLLLVAFEELLVNGRKGVFALMVGLCCVINYFFFVGQVVFVLLYFFVRISMGDIKLKFKRFLAMALEAVLGVGIAAFLLLPSVLALMGNPRTDQLINGWNAILYYNVQRYPAILQSFLFPADLPPTPFFFPNAGLKWMSSAGWLPLFSVSGVIAWLFAKQKNFFRRMILFCLLFMFIPGLNSLFYMLNSSTYARWYYMPVLLMALVSVASLEDPEVEIRRGIKWTMILTLSMALLIGLMPNFVGEELRIGLSEVPALMWGSAGIAVLSLLVFLYIILFCREKPYFTRVLCVVTSAMVLISGYFYLATGKMTPLSDQKFIKTSINRADSINLPDDEFYRVDVQHGMDNQAMFWKLPTIQTFHSVVPASIMEFYPSVGVKRDVGSRPEPEDYVLRGYLSVKYIFIPQDSEYEVTTPGFVYYDNQNYFDIYENQYFVPMGFTYDYYYTDDTFGTISTTSRQQLLTQAIYLTPEQAEEYGHLLREMREEDTWDFSDEKYLAACAALAANAGYEFTHDNYGFTSKIVLDSPNLVHFTIPYEKGWSATVNGEPAEVLKVNNGLMAVAAPAGDCEIRFSYMTPGLIEGMVITFGSLLVLLVYLLINRMLDRRRGDQMRVSAEDFQLRLESPREEEIETTFFYYDSQDPEDPTNR